MKTNVRITYCSIGIATIAFILSLLFQFANCNCISNETQKYLVSVFVSIFASALLLFPVSIIHYINDRKATLERLYLKIDRYYYSLNQYCLQRSDNEKECFINDIKIKFSENYIDDVKNTLYDIHFMFRNNTKFNRINSVIYAPFAACFDDVLSSKTKDEFEKIMSFPDISDEYKLCVCKFPKRRSLEKAKKDFYYQYMYGYSSYLKAKKGKNKK